MVLYLHNQRYIKRQILVNSDNKTLKMGGGISVERWSTKEQSGDNPATCWENYKTHLIRYEYWEYTYLTHMWQQPTICCLLWVDGSQHGTPDDAPEVTHYNTTLSRSYKEVISHTNKAQCLTQKLVFALDWLVIFWLIGIFNLLDQLDLFISLLIQMNGF